MSHNYFEQLFLMAPGYEFKQSELEEIYNKVKKMCNFNSQVWNMLALAYAKYDYFGAPSNWLPEFKYEIIIKEMVEDYKGQYDKNGINIDDYFLINNNQIKFNDRQADIFYDKKYHKKVGVDIEDIFSILEEYLNGQIPDCSNIMDDHFI